MGEAWNAFNARVKANQEAARARKAALAKPSNPVEHILAAMEAKGLRNPDLYDIFGNKGRTSEILRYKRPLMLRHVLPLHQRLGIPLHVLVQPYEPPAVTDYAVPAKDADHE